MSKIAHRLASLKAQGRKGLIPFITAGDPHPELTVPLLHALVRGGADVIELGVPFSDPMADGPVIQRASERALAQQVGLKQVFQMVTTFRQTDTETPIVLMGYANPIERMGYEAFTQACVAAQVDGVLTVDYPPEESVALAAQLRSQAIDPIFLLAPTSTPERIAHVAEQGSGYIYYVSLKGITGAGHVDIDAVAARVPVIQEQTRLPVGVGFGIRDGATAKAIGACADAVVIGSRIIQEMEQVGPAQAVSAVETFLREIRTALDS
ncbi:tryptophan synthase subunit alpha [Parvibium lacunae]|uniref:Tryptophan synthase alpha chain n=1 Tax=Parvibium lacunae TaxID=1888893 RepID=A0A368L394_9BURK|nr:tryptophan synthase subunit alpha [Parvibium lacunae]RCS58061.1 tryptophan synthase subunit alpha [Parvibium lacunae]